MTEESKPIQTRRAFIKGAALASTGVALGTTLSGHEAQAQAAGPAGASHPTMMGYIAPGLEKVRFGLIGTGARGTRHLRSLLGLAGVGVIAICDTDPVSLENAKKVVAGAGVSSPDYYTGNDYAYRDMLERDDIDAVIISTPWRWHAPMSIDTMNAGKHAFVEVPMATTIEDMWEMVEVSERTRMNCMMMENVCYGRDEMMVLNMVRQGLFGELTHGEGAYIHNLRQQMEQTERGTGSWRTHYHTNQKGNIYPTHGLGPIAQYMNINRGDRFDYMTSLSSPALGRAAFAKREFPADHERNRVEYINGDMNSTLIKTAMGRSILVQHDTTTARPYSRLNLVQGTGGTFAGFPNRIAVDLAAVAGIVPEEIRAEYQLEFENYDNRVAEWTKAGKEGRRPSQENSHHWDTGMDKWRKYFDHPLWKNMKKIAQQAGGHGGMDFIMLWRMVNCLQNGIALDQNVYDGAAWSSLFPLSHESVTQRSKSLDIPDFTRGAWKTAKTLDITV
jgi:predicted dehydrogenase